MASLLANFQTSFWIQIFDSFPPPMFWLPPIVYLSLYRKPVEGILTIYFLCIMFAAMSSMTIGVLGLIFLFMFVGFQALKLRIFWPGPYYFMLSCGIASLTFHIFHYLTTWLFSDVTTFLPDWAQLISEISLTPIISFPIYHVFSWIDRLTFKESLIEARQEI